ncbi:LuxR C-terminal-related transcriptional regulator [Streptacidiphilus jiangxiensis]|uniref:DNA-binding response regulator, NarL/FixJ family, contains REC and HTH domains n=1 Tax=Streptacidiphilus jiangxiensis TaxID=235985 RepID=A0A1H7QPE6_STRJI|nr:response regulator transcription factor [Streptacidiphilus jiangxiensis]SEL49846.1 DNA-binding response regulator, NarL/FixJ family, contains REC and HTH domains [Streptacidiphilus jiangxiensis]
MTTPMSPWSTLQLPNQAPPDPQEGTDPPTPLVLGDGHRLLLDALALALADRGFHVRATATTCAEVLRTALEFQPAVCLTELHLADGSALDLIGRLHAEARAVRVLVLSTDAEPASVAAAIEAGAVGYLTKDQSIDAIEQALGRILHGELVLTPALSRDTLRHLRRERTEQDDPLRWLTQRERQVLERLTEGDGTAEMARVLGMASNTARTHVQNVLDKLGVHSRLEAVAMAHKAGLVRQ